MSKGIVPITKLSYPYDAVFPLELRELFERLGLQAEDEFTYTTRFTVPEEKIATVKRQLRKQFPDEAPAFIALMDDLGWDVSFLVDCY